MKGRDLLVMWTVAAQMAFEEDEAIHQEWLRPQGGFPPEKFVYRFGVSAIPACQRDVRRECPVLGFEPDLMKGAFHLRG